MINLGGYNPRNPLWIRAWFGVQKSPVGPGMKPQQGSEDGVGSLGAKAGLATLPLSPIVVSIFAVDASFRVSLAPHPGVAADNHLFPH